MKKVLHYVVLLVGLGFSLIGFAAGSVDLNQADAKTMSQVLKGVGPKKAEQIIQFREENGYFKTADDLAKVKGIGKRLVELNRERIVITIPEGK